MSVKARLFPLPSQHLQMFLSFWNFPLCSAFHFPGKLACCTLPLNGKSLFIVFKLCLWRFGEMLLQLDTFHGSKTFHALPRAFTSTILCTGLALCFMGEFPILNLPILAMLKEKSHHSARLLPPSPSRDGIVGILPHKTVLFQRCSWCAAAPLLRPQEGQCLGVKMLLSDAKHLILHLFGWFFSYLNKLEQAWQRAGRESFPGQLVSVIQ